MSDAVLSWIRQLDFSFLTNTLMILLASVLCITVHECSHGLAAYWMGDRTAKHQGRLTLNPIRHIDPMGLLLMAIARFGWAKPVPVNMNNFSRPRLGMALTALAGPVSNILFAFLALLIRGGLMLLLAEAASYNWLLIAIEFLAYLVILNCGLAVFNLLPIPPLDGSKVWAAFLPVRLHRWLMRFERYGMILLAIVLLTNLLDSPLFYLRSTLLSVLERGSIYLISLLCNI